MTIYTISYNSCILWHRSKSIWNSNRDKFSLECMALLQVLLAVLQRFRFLCSLCNTNCHLPHCLPVLLLSTCHLLPFCGSTASLVLPVACCYNSACPTPVHLPPVAILWVYCQSCLACCLLPQFQDFLWKINNSLSVLLGTIGMKVVFVEEILYSHSFVAFWGSLVKIIIFENHK